MVKMANYCQLFVINAQMYISWWFWTLSLTDTQYWEFHITKRNSGQWNVIILLNELIHLKPASKHIQYILSVYISLVTIIIVFPVTATYWTWQVANHKVLGWAALHVVDMSTNMVNVWCKNIPCWFDACIQF